MLMSSLPRNPRHNPKLTCTTQSLVGHICYIKRPPNNMNDSFVRQLTTVHMLKWHQKEVLLLKKHRKGNHQDNKTSQKRTHFFLQPFPHISPCHFRRLLRPASALAKSRRNCSARRSCAAFAAGDAKSSAMAWRTFSGVKRLDMTPWELQGGLRMQEVSWWDGKLGVSWMIVLVRDGWVGCAQDVVVGNLRRIEVRGKSNKSQKYNMHQNNGKQWLTMGVFGISWIWAASNNLSFGESLVSHASKYLSFLPFWSFFGDLACCSRKLSSSKRSEWRPKHATPCFVHTLSLFCEKWRGRSNWWTTCLMASS